MFKVLIVDDEKIVRIALKSIINWNEYGMTVVGGASDGVLALEMIERHQPDIVITDLKMPNMDGIQLITALNERKFRGKVLVLSNYGDFELVRDALKLGAVDYILKVTMKTDEFIHTLKKIMEQLKAEREMRDKSLLERTEINEARRILRNNFFRDLFTLEAYHYSEMESEAKKAGLQEGIEKSFMLYLQVDAYEKALADSKLKEKKLLAFSIRNILGEILSGIDSLEIIEMDYGRFAVIMPVQALDAAESFVDRTAKSVADSIGMYLNISASIIVSEVFEGFYGARKAFRTCEKLSGLIFFKGPSSMLKAGEINPNEGALDHRYDEIYTALAGFLQAGDFAEFNGKLLEVSEFAKENCFPGELKGFLIRLFEDLEKYSFIDNAGLDDVSEKYKEDIANSESISDMNTVAGEIVCWLFEGARRYSEKHRKEVGKAIEYITENITRKISLSVVAEHVNMNYSYFCKVFKKETGKSLVSYINKAKIELSLELLKNSNLSIKEIAAEIGFDDQFYFNRIFRKYTGVSPTEYRTGMFG